MPFGQDGKLLPFMKTYVADNLAGDMPQKTLHSPNP